MIYDLIGHKNHVLSSPFTCFDWERSKVYKGKSLRNVFPVGVIQFNDFFEARRGLKNYIADLANNNISYREYVFSGNSYKESRKNFKLDKIHQVEYIYHIMKFLLINYLKLISHENRYYSNSLIKSKLKLLFLNSKLNYQKYFSSIAQKKEQNIKDTKKDNNLTFSFINDLQLIIKEDYSKTLKLKFIRHFKTKLNINTFLGQERDPEILSDLSNSFNYVSDAKVYSSPMKRCLQTAEQLIDKNNILVDNRLNEFNYGFAEGLSYDQLIKKYPSIYKDWENHKDARFPNGENSEDVLIRLNSFLNDLNKNQNKTIYIITHNGVLRCLIGAYYGLRKSEWYKVNIPYGIPLDFLFFRKKLIPNLSRKIYGRIFSDIEKL